MIALTVVVITALVGSAEVVNVDVVVVGAGYAGCAAVSNDVSCRIAVGHTVPAWWGGHMPNADTC